MLSSASRDVTPSSDFVPVVTFSLDFCAKALQRTTQHGDLEVSH